MASTFGRMFLLPLSSRSSVLRLHPIRFPFSSVPAFSNEIIKKQNLAAEKFKKAIEQKMGKIAVDTSDIILPDYACPFDIKETPGKRSFILERKYGDETIQVETTPHENLMFYVTITKPGDVKRDEFQCCVPPHADFSIESKAYIYSFKNPVMDKKEAFDYLEKRGIDKEFGKFLYAYMSKKYGREYLTVLNRVTNFFEK